MFSELTNAQVQIELGRRVRAHRVAQKLTQQDLADRAGISRPAISRLERGHDVALESLLSVLRALRLLNALDAAVGEPPDSPIEALGRSRLASTVESGWTWGDEQ